jgi:hypothetical protein
VEVRRSRWSVCREDVGVLKWYGSVGIATVLAVGALGWAADAHQPTAGNAYASASGQNDLVTYFVSSDGKPSVLTVIDAESRRIAVYHVNRESGEIQLKSVRNIAWDLGMEYFNSGHPLPEEIRKGLERQQ